MARGHAQPSEVASMLRALAYSTIRLHENLGKPRGRGLRVNSKADRGGERVCAIGTCDARLRRGLCMVFFIGFCNGCFWAAIQCEVWTKPKRPCKPYFIFGMNYGPTPVGFAMRNQVRMNVFWVVQMCTSDELVGAIQVKSKQAVLASTVERSVQIGARSKHS